MNNNKFPILFLDLDGTLTTPPNWRDFNPDCVNNLKFIIKETGAKIVVHSTWRLWPNNQNRFLYLWGKYGFSLEDFWQFLPTYHNDKKLDIEYYIQSKGVENFVIIDDEDYNFPPDKFVQPKNGLSFDDAKLAIEILNR